MSVYVDAEKKVFTVEMTCEYETKVIECPDCGFAFGVEFQDEEWHRGVYSCPACLSDDLKAEMERMCEAMKGATVIANHAGGRIRELEQENQRYREALETIGNMHRLKYSVTAAIEVAKKALEGGENAGAK